jgi:hypothetical protein
MDCPALSKSKWIPLIAMVWLLICCLPAFCAEPEDSDIWTDEEPMMEDPWSERRIEGFLSRLEQENPERAAQLRKLRQENPEKFQQELRAEFQKMFQPPAQPQPGGPQGPAGPGGGPQGPPPQGPGPEGGRGGRWAEHLQRRHDEFIQWLEKNNPELAGELAQIKDKDQSAYFSRVMEAHRKYDSIMDAEKRNPELAKVLKEDLVLQKQRDELIKKIRSAQGDQRDQYIQDLRALISRRFDLIIQKKTLQYQELEQRLKRLQLELEKRQAEVVKLKGSKDQAVEDHVKELTTQNEKINWD